jgi:hypothetical protein
MSAVKFTTTALTPAATTKFAAELAAGNKGHVLLSSITASDAEARALAATTKFITPANLAARALFSVYMAANKTDVATDTYTKIPFNTEVHDVGAYFDAATDYDWTPPAGPVRLSAGAYLSAGITDATLAAIRITKNGAGYRQVIMYEQMTGQAYGFISIVDVANGTDAYAVEIFGTTASNITVNGGATNTWFMGEQI